jgi:hypothetical protein
MDKCAERTDCIASRSTAYVQEEFFRAWIGRLSAQFPTRSVLADNVGWRIWAIPETQQPKLAAMVRWRTKANYQAGLSQPTQNNVELLLGAEYQLFHFDRYTLQSQFL